MNYPLVIKALKYLDSEHRDISKKKARLIGVLIDDWCDGTVNDAEYSDSMKSLTGFAPNLKKWDDNDPLKKAKAKLEEVLLRLFDAYLAAQISKMEKSNILTLSEDVDDKFQVKVENALLFGATQGAEYITTQLSVGLAEPNRLAAEWAKEYAYDLIKDINETSRKLVQDAVSGFIENQGSTLQDIIDKLKPEFGERRASLIATTETTRAFSQGNQIAFEEASKEFPNAKRVKNWYTNEDERVCEICSGNEEAGEVDYDEPYPSGDMHVPAHPGDRCWEEFSLQ